MLRIVISDSFDRSETSYQAYEVLILGFLEKLDIFGRLGLGHVTESARKSVAQLVFEQYAFCSDGSIIVRVTFFPKEGDLADYDEILLELRDKLGEFLSSQPALSGLRIQADAQQERLAVKSFPQALPKPTQ